MKTSLYRLVSVIAAVAWLFGVIFSYFIVHKPFTGANALAIGDVFVNLVVANLMTVLALGIGTRVLRGFDFASRVQALVFRIGLGFAVISFATCTLGLVGLLQPIVFWALALGAIIFTRNDIYLQLVGLDLNGCCPTRWEKFLALCVALTFVFALVVALAPPIEWDAQLYHLLEGKYALARGRIAAPPDIPTFNYPSLVEMIYLAALALKGDIVAKLLHWSFGVLAVAAIWDCARRVWNTQVAWVAAATLMAVPTFVVVVGWAYSDAALALYSFGAFYAVITANEKEDRRWLVLAGIFAGCALGTKNTALIIPWALAVLIWRFNRRAALNAAIFLVVAFGVASPWYIRNLVFVGNPIYPYFIGGQNWDAFRAAWGTRWGTGLLNDPLRLLLVPWDATINGQEGTDMYAATLGPLMLAFIPLLLVGGFSRQKTVLGTRVLRDALVFSLIGYMFWLLGVAMSKLLLQSRYLIPIFTTLALAVGVALERLNQVDLRSFSLARFARLVFGLVLVLTLVSQGLSLIALNPVPYLAGFETRNEYLMRRMEPRGYLNAMQELGKLPSPSLTLFLWETRSYYAPDVLAAQPDQLLDTWADLVYRFHDAESIARDLQSKGFTHVLLNRTGLDFMLQSGYDPITSADLQALQDFEANYLRPINARTPLKIVTRDGKPGVLDADKDAYLLYEIVGRGQ